MVNLEILRKYQDFAKYTQKLLWNAPRWKQIYAGYARDLLKNMDKMDEKRKTLGSQKALEPLWYYTTIDAIRGHAKFDFDLRYLGQSVGTIKILDGKPILCVSEQKANTSYRDFGYNVGKINDEVWDVGKKAITFRTYYQTVSQQAIKTPRQREHMVESALLTELGKKQGATKALKFIQPITCIPGVRLHMKTALRASDAASGVVSVSDQGGDIDVFCRRKIGNRSRLTVIEVKDENKSSETFHIAIKQAIAYAVFIRELARSQSGPDWMELWGLGKQPWKEGFTINAVAAMPKGTTTEFPFAGMVLELEDEQHKMKDYIELHYLAFLGEDQPRDGQDVLFKTSL